MDVTQPPEAAPRDGAFATIVRAGVYAATAFLLLRTVASADALVAAGILGAAGAVAARLADGWRIRASVAIAAAAALAGLGIGAGHLLLEVSFGPGVEASLLWSDMVTWASVSLAAAFAMRILGSRYPLAAGAEAVAVVGAAAASLLPHRDRMIHQPRALSDWAWSRGIDPRTVIEGIGLAAALAAMLLLFRARRPFKAATSFLLLSGLVLACWLNAPGRLEPKADTGGLGLTTQEQQARERDDGAAGGPGDGEAADGGGRGRGDGGTGGGQAGQAGGESEGGGSGAGGQGGEGRDKGRGSGGGRGNAQGDSGGGGDGGGAGGAPRTTIPMAIAIFHDEYDPPDGVYYFRQQVLSSFDGNHLVAGGGFDADVLSEFPTTGPVEARETGTEEFFQKVPTSMYLLADHPQPLALSSSIRLAPRENPDPGHFVVAYDAISHSFVTDPARLVGRDSIPEDWTPERRAHYLAMPDDPRYRALSDEIVREGDPRFRGDPIMTALLIKRYLEKEGFYTRRVRYEDPHDPTAAFLFGDLRGYCVHFAHAAAMLMRSQGVASRVAVGYGVQGTVRGGGSTVMILSHQAHAWPELHVAGVGWIPLDIHPERSDEPPPILADQDLESLLGELARRDASGGKAEAPRAPFRVPWGRLASFLAALAAAVLATAYAVKATRVVLGRVGSGPAAARRAFVSVLDRLADLGMYRRPGETRERFAARVARVAPAFESLTRLHLRQALGRPGAVDITATRAAVAAVGADLARTVPAVRRALGWLNPIGWTKTR